MNIGFAYKRQLIAGAVALVVAGSAFMPLAAHAQDNSGPNGVPGQSCAVEIVDGNGNTIGYKQVPVGTRYGLIYCGQDGNWHFGWLTNAVVRAPVASNPLPSGILPTANAPTAR